jgi:N-acetyltransferase
MQLVEMQSVGMQFEAKILEGRLVRLEPLCESHKVGLAAAIADGELWKLFVTLVPAPSELDSYLARAQRQFAQGEGIAFATIDKTSGQVVGATRFLNANLPNKRVEIGATFLAQRWQKTRINTEAKYLMLRHAFETMGLNRVELITDFLNQSSRRAILGLGAREEGILRSHMVMPNGRVRDSVIYSITANDWSGVKQHLEYKLTVI